MTECGVLNLNCVPRCDCDEGFVGSSCSLLLGDMIEEMSIRHLIIESVS
jgi:hypothetical protein